MKVPSLKIGTLTIDPPIVLAPMAGLTDAAFRVICSRYGTGLTFTEMANTEGIVRGMRRTLHLLTTDPSEGPVGAHIYGAVPERFAAAAVVIERMGFFDLIDINCGCPVHRIVAKGCGAALTRDPKKLEAVVKAVKSTVKLPVTVKTRLGFSDGEINISEVAHAAEAAGADAITIHCRSASGRHSGVLRWDILARVKTERRIPIIGNGGVETPADALRMFRETGVDGVMIGRAAVGNPWILREIGALLKGENVENCSSAERRSVIIEHFERLLALKELERRYRRRCRFDSETAAAMQFRTHLLKYLAKVKGVGRLRKNLDTIRSRRDVLCAVNELLPEVERDEAPGWEQEISCGRCS